MTVATCFLVLVRCNESGMLRRQGPDFGIERQGEFTTGKTFNK